jgi:hypothetical protein
VVCEPEAAHTEAGEGLSEDAWINVLAATLHAAIDGDFLVGAGMRHGNVGEDVAHDKASIKEIVWWAVHAIAPLLRDRQPARVAEGENGLHWLCPKGHRNDIDPDRWRETAEGPCRVCPDPLKDYR